MGAVACEAPVDPVATAPEGSVLVPEGGGAYVGAADPRPGTFGAKGFLAGFSAEAGTLAVHELQFFASRGEFEDAAPGLAVEDFEASSLEEGTADACPGPFNSETDDHCFIPGAILEGLSVHEVDERLMVVLRPGFMGVEGTAVGPLNTFHHAQVDFSMEVHAVGVSLLAPMGGPAPITVAIFGADDTLLGTTEAQVGATTGEFWGVISPVPIERLQFFGADEVGELFEFVSFGALEASPEGQDIVVEVKVGEGRTPINAYSRGVIPVMVRSSEEFDAASIDPASLRFGPGEARALEASARRMQAGRSDVVFHFPTQDAGLECDDTEVILRGETMEGTPFQGSDEVEVLCSGGSGRTGGQPGGGGSD